MIIVSMLTYNKVDYTKKCIESIFKSTSFPPYKLVVSDNGSTDSTVEYLKSLEDKIIFMNNMNNIGFTVAHNNIMKAFYADDVVLMNNDIEVSENWLTTINHMIDKEGYGAAGPAIQTPGGLDVGAVLNGQARGRSLINDFNTEPDWITGSCFYIPRSTINKVGLLDESFKFYYEDVDYCRRIKEAGLKLKCIKNVVIKHNDSTSSTPAEKKQLIEESRRYFAQKWGYQV